MAGRQAFAALTRGMAPERRQRVEAKKAVLRADMTLAEVRQAIGMSQQQVGQGTGVGQPAVAKLEKRDDMLVSSLRDYVASLGGELRIFAHFPGMDVQLTNFGIQSD